MPKNIRFGDLVRSSGRPTVHPDRRPGPDAGVAVGEVGALHHQDVGDAFAGSIHACVTQGSSRASGHGAFAFGYWDVLIMIRSESGGVRRAAVPLGLIRPVWSGGQRDGGAWEGCLELPA